MKQWRRWIVFMVGFAIMLAAGLVFSFSIFIEPIEAEMGFSRSETSLIFPISLSVSILGQILAGLLAGQRKIRLNFMLTAFLNGMGFFLASKTQSLQMLLLSYGMMTGLAIGMMYNGVLSTVVLQFEDRADLIAGLLLMGFGLGSMALGTLSAGLIDQIGWRNTFRFFAVLFFVLSVAGALIITRPAGTWEQAVRPVGGGVQIPSGRMIRQRAYLLTFLWITVLVSIYLVISGHAAMCMSDIGATPYLAALAIGLVSIANVAARIVISAAFDWLGTVRIQYLLTFLGLVSSAVCLGGYLGGWMPAMLAGYFMLGFLNGGCTIVINSYVMNQFGNENFGINMAITNIHLAIASFLGPLAAGVLKTVSGNYTTTFIAMIGFSLLSLSFLKASLGIKAVKIIKSM